MMPVRYPILLAFLLAACATQPTAPIVDAVPARPLEVLPPGVSASSVRADLIATAGERFGQAALDRAMAAPTHLIAKRFAGMAPPPPPGAAPDWQPPTPAALLIRDSSGWSVATADGWRAADPTAAAELDRLIGDARFWAEPFFTQACPDYGASLLLLKVPGRPETVRNSQCTSRSASVVDAALRA